MKINIKGKHEALKVEFVCLATCEDERSAQVDDSSWKLDDRFVTFSDLVVR